MAKVTFEHPIATISGKLNYRGNVILRTRNGRTHAYIVEHPYTGPVAPERQRTINAFAEAVKQAKTILNDPLLSAQWEKKFEVHKAYVRRHPRTPYKVYSTLRGFIIGQLTQQLNAQAKQSQSSEPQQDTPSTATTQTLQTTLLVTPEPSPAVTQTTTTTQTTGTTEPAQADLDGSQYHICDTGLS